MVSAATRRKRLERQNRLASAIEQSYHDAEVEQKTLGTVLSSKVPNVTLFKEDRKGETKQALEQKFAQNARRQRLADKRARRAAPKIRRSEIGAEPQTPMESVSYVRSKKKVIAPVEKAILKKRTFDQPRGHIGNRSVLILAAKRHVPGKEDMWTSSTAKEVEVATSKSRIEFAHKASRKQRRAHAVVYPDAGHSFNPSFEHHQDNLGEAVAKIVSEEDREQWIEQKLSFDPALLNESTKDIDAITGMKVDQPGDENGSKEADVSGDNHDNVIKKPIPERKTRAERNKEARKRSLALQIRKKRAEERRAADFKNFDKILEDATEESDKLNGITKKRLKRQHVPVPNRKRNRPVISRIAGQRVRNETASMPVALSTEISGSLRNFKVPNSNPLLTDRILSFERRGMVEPPNVLPMELRSMELERRQDERRDKTNGEGNTANLALHIGGKSRKSVKFTSSFLNFS